MNTSTSILIPSHVFRSLPVEAQEALIAALRGDAEGSSTAAVMLGKTSDSEGALPSSEALSGSDEALDIQTDLSPAQFKQLVDGCADKTKAALKAMVEGPTSTFKVASIAKAAGCGPNELSGVASGITKRVRTVTGDRKAYLWIWGEAKFDGDGRYIDQDATVSETTYRSGRRVFGL
jgi:hypothetical protein